MGFFKKLVKGVKKVFKKIGKAVKSVFKKVGKFMGKIGIVGQLGLMLIAPYAMPMLGAMATSMMGTTLGGISGAIVKGAGQFLNAAVKVGTRVGQAFKSVTSAVTGTIKNTVGATLNKMGLGNAVKGISGWDISGLDFKTAFEKSGELWTKAGDDLGQLFSKSTFDSSMNKFGIEASLKENMPKELTADVSYDPVTGETSFGVDRATGTVGNQGVGLDVADSLGLGTPGTTYGAGGLPLGTDEALFTVGGTAPTSSLLSPAPLTEAALQTSDIAMATRPAVADPFASVTMDVADYVPKAPEQTLMPSSGLGTHTVAEATAWEKAKEAAAEAGVPTTLAGVAEYMAQEDYEYEFPTARQDYVDYGSLATSPIYPTSSGLAYANMLAPDPCDAPSLSQAIANGDYMSLYQNDRGESGYYYGAPSLYVAMAQNAQAQLYE